MTSKKRYLKVRYLIRFIIICIATLLLIFINNNTSVQLIKSYQIASWHLHASDVMVSEESFTIKTEGCTIPALKPFHESIAKYLLKEYSNNVESCPNTNYALLENNDSHIWIQLKNLPYYHVHRNENVICCYQSFYRLHKDHDYNVIIYELCVFFSTEAPIIKVNHEFIKVSCHINNTNSTIYKKYILFAPYKPLQRYSNKISQDLSYNVIIIGIDGMSRLNFHRTMPKTLNYLKNKGAVELLGYNKVGDNSLPNLVPMLMGITVEDLDRYCWNKAMEGIFDNCPFIWDWFKDVGYYTALGEDVTRIDSAFSIDGFVNNPTDYFISLFMNEAAENDGKYGHGTNYYLCMGNKYFFKVLLDYILSLIKTLKTLKLFGFFWETTITHDFLKYSIYTDDSYENFLKTLDDMNYLYNTILIIMSDHGTRWGSLRMTKQGQIEERLPLMQILLPPSFKENFSKAYDNLKLNRRRLTTPFDMYATLFDLVDLKALENEHIEFRSKTSYSEKRGISLFLPIPSNRTCAMAGITAHWCTCHRSVRLSAQSDEACTAGAQLVLYLNGLLRGYGQCAPLALSKVLDFSENLVGKQEELEGWWQEFVIVVRVSPGGGVFEGTLRHGNRNWLPAGSVSRLNRYGNQSRCIHEHYLKLYCYCY